MKILSWNVRGLGGWGKVEMVRKVVQGKGVDFVGITETKKSRISQFLVHKIWGYDDSCWDSVEAINGGGGLLCIWDCNFLSDVVISKGDRWICVKGKLSGSEFVGAFCLVYGPHTRQQRANLWIELVNLRRTVDVPVIFFGDFNEVLIPEERKGGQVTTSSIRDFREWVQDLQLYDMPIAGRKFTWYGGSSCSRLDRFLVDADWLFKFQHLKVWGLNRALSDHCPLLMEEKVVDWGPKPFRNLDIWFSNEGFHKLIHDEWKKLGNKKIYDKFREIKGPIREWNRKEFGVIDDKIKGIEDEIMKIDLAIEQGCVDETEIARRSTLMAMCEVWYERKDSYWKQLSREKMAKEMDRNTKYFHNLAAGRRRKKLILKLVVNNRTIRKPDAIKKEIRSFYRYLYRRDEDLEIDFPENLVQSLTAEEATELEIIPTLEEIKNAVWACDPSKAPGVDGFNMGFVQKMWAEIGNDFSAEVLEFFQTRRLRSEINMTSVVLIPKVEGACELKDFRPISMVGCLYKTISKILSTRIRNVMPKLVGEVQSAFVVERQILDGALITCEAINWLRKKKKQAVILKLDFQKAYDMVNWDFIGLTLSRMGFGRTWRAWIHECISSASMSVLVNSVPTKPFKMERGLRQGDPISPFLFVLVAEVLNKFIELAVRSGKIEGLQIGHDDVSLTHLQFADDTIIFCPANEVTLKNYMMLLDCFCSMSGLCINYKKSVIIPLGCVDQWALKMKRLLGCEVAKLPFTYLGIPVGANPKRIRTWDPIIERIESRLSMWRSKTITKAGKLVLIKAVINNLPLYYLSLFRMPTQVVNKIISLQTRFFWGKPGGGRGIPLVKWSQVQLPKEHGGLGVGEVVIKNVSLLFKWWWRFHQEDCPLWKRIVQSCNRMQAGGINSNLQIMRPIGGPWQSICEVAKKDEWMKEICETGIRFQIGNGDKVLFWEDLWVGNQTLKKGFPSLYNVSAMQNHKVADFGFWDGLDWIWHFQWKRNLFQWEMQIIDDLHNILLQAKLNVGADDKLTWRFDKKGLFTTKSCAITASKMKSTPNEVNSFNYSCTIWKGLVPPRVEMLAWFVVIERLNTRDRLHRMNIIPNNVLSCVLCKQEHESISHIFFCCEFAMKLWEMWKMKWNITWVGPSKPKDFFEAWVGTQMRRDIRNKWRTAFFVTIWILWRTRNSFVFENKEPRLEEAMTNAQFWLEQWKKEKKKR